MAIQTLVDKEVEFLTKRLRGGRPRMQADPELVKAAIAEAAYYKAESRGFTPGHEIADWLAAESEVHEQMNLSLAPTVGKAGLRAP